MLILDMPEDSIDPTTSMPTLVTISSREAESRLPTYFKGALTVLLVQPWLEDEVNLLAFILEGCGCGDFEVKCKERYHEVGGVPRYLLGDVEYALACFDRETRNVTSILTAESLTVVPWSWAPSAMHFIAPFITRGTQIPDVFQPNPRTWEIGHLSPATAVMLSNISLQPRQMDAMRKLGLMV